MDITREDLIQAIASDLEGRTGTDAAIAAIGAIEALGFVIVPRVPTMYMRARADTHLIMNMTADPFEAQWDGAISGSPLYQDGAK